MSSPPKLGTIEGAQNLWDELQWVHTYQANVIHGVGDPTVSSDPLQSADEPRRVIASEVGALGSLQVLKHHICNFFSSVLPWHRYYVRVHEILLQTVCNYSGAQPYWDEQQDGDTSIGEWPITQATA